MIHAIFFLSGVSALIFQHIWFRQAGLVFGNSVWASSLVLSSFMAGLAVGNGITAFRPGVRHTPLLWYSLLELMVALTGVGLVFLMPMLGGTLVPFIFGIVGGGMAIELVRFALAFALLVIPTAAMGMTLPILAGRTRSGEVFGVALGRLYGWNTLGAVLGALAGEAVLYERIGIRNTAFVAGALNILAALLSLALSRSEQASAPPPDPRPEGRLTRSELQLLMVAALAGGSLLALEVVWTRFLLLFTFGTALAFSIMLAMALIGIAAGSLLASRASRLCETAEAVPTLAMLAAIAVTGSYSSFADVVRIDLGSVPGMPWTQLALRCAALILPTALISGALFTAVGASLARSRVAAKATGLLTLANTLGAMAGAMLAGFLLLPLLGMERAFWFIAATYVVAAAISPGSLGLLRRSRPLLAVTLVGLLFTALFPRGLMERTYLRDALRPFVGGGGAWTHLGRITGFREGLTETIAYVDTIFEGQVLSTRLVTNAFSMSGTFFAARRYMEAFVYLPVAIHPHVRRALLISYGVGSTARALTSTPEIEAIDVVDISRDVLDMAHYAVRPGDVAPLSDPRVVTHVEDGRFFLQTASEGYDLITSEPPPPHLGGVVNLYTLEYFALLRKRLNPGGMVSYWLPVHALSDNDSRAILSAFCSVFPDCTLWKGMDLDWILLGTKDAKGPIALDRFTKQWSNERRRALHDIGIETPEQMGALFMAEGQSFPELVGAKPLQDNYPGRLSRSPPPSVFGPWKEALMDPVACRERFMNSVFIRRIWPEAMRTQTLPYFEVQRHYDEILSNRFPGLRGSPPLLSAVSLLRTTPLAVLPAILLGTPGDYLLLAQRMLTRSEAERDTSFLHAHLGILDLTAKRYDSATAHLRRALELAPSSRGLRERLALTLCLGGKLDQAERERRTLPATTEASWTEALDRACRTVQ